MVMLISHRKYECAVIAFFTDVMIVHMVNDCITSRPLWPVAKRIKIARSSKQSLMIFSTGNCVRVYLSELTFVKWPKLSLLMTLLVSVCVFFVWFFGLDLYPYLFIYLFISLIYYYWFITQLNVSWKLEVYMANWLLPVMALKNLINYVSNTFIGIPAESNRHAFCNRFNARDISKPLWIPFAWPQELQWQSIWSSLYDTSEVKLAKIQI